MNSLDDGRGRQPIVSTGRGGAGNLIRSPSRGVDPDVQPGMERGRETKRDQSVDRIIRSGRGGAGNLRSPSRGPDPIYEATEDALQARLVAEERGRQSNANFSTGRGGAGNITRSTSRSRSAVREPVKPSGGTPQHHAISGGRGGWGNIREDRDTDHDSIDEQKAAAADRYEAEVRAKRHAEEANRPHTSGKGGAGNFAKGAPPGVDMSQLTIEEREAYNKVHANDSHDWKSTGRGGGGNLHRVATNSGEERGREAHKEDGMFHKVLRSVSRATGHDRKND